MAKDDRQSLYGEVTNRIIAELEEGRVPWVQPWVAARCPVTMPQNGLTGRVYSGINVLILWAAGIGGGHSSQRWLTYKQAEKAGGNPRAAAIAQLVLWIGYLQWHFRVNGKDRAPPEPILRDVRTIENRDALIAWDDKVLERDEHGQPVSRWDGETMKLHPVTGRPVPDESARVEVYRYVKPRAAKWPKADFIVGNPPFIGGKDVRDRLGDGYFKALFATTDVPESADFVMHWWDKAATAVRKHGTRRFGFVTTNSIMQVFSRRVIAKHLDAKDRVSLLFAIPNHPWVDEKDGAAVRIAMTVAAPGKSEGQHWTVADESRAPDHIVYTERFGQISSDLRIGADVTAAVALKANDNLCSPGVKLHGDGFIVTPEQAASLESGSPGSTKTRTTSLDFPTPDYAKTAQDAQA